MTARLTDAELASELASLPGWTRQGPALSRAFSFASFADAIAFVTRLAFEAESADHHPDLQVSYRTVTVTWTTHSAGGITSKDLAGARKSEEFALRLAPVA